MSKTPKPDWLLKAEAKTIKQKLDITHSQALDKVAMKYGYDNWGLYQKHRAKTNEQFQERWARVTEGFCSEREILDELNEIWINCPTDSKAYIDTKQWLDLFLSQSGAGVHIGRAMVDSYYDGIFNTSNSWVIQYWREHSEIIDTAYHGYMAYLDELYNSAYTEDEIHDIADEADYLINKFSHFHDIITQPEILDVKPNFH